MSSGPLSPGSSPSGGAEPLGFVVVGDLVCLGGAEVDLLGVVGIFGCCP